MTAAFVFGILLNIFDKFFRGNRLWVNAYYIKDIGQDHK